MDLPESLLQIVADSPQSQSAEAIETAGKQHLPLLYVEKDKRRGKMATLITGYDGDCDEVRELAKYLKQQLATGGSVRDGEILLQGDVRDKVIVLLESKGYKTKRRGG